MQQQNPYNQPPMGPVMPQQPRVPLQHRMMRGARGIQDVFPRWLTTYPFVTYILALVVVSFMYSSYTFPWYNKIG